MEAGWADKQDMLRAQIPHASHRLLITLGISVRVSRGAKYFADQNSDSCPKDHLLTRVARNGSLTSPDLWPNAVRSKMFQL